MATTAVNINNAPDAAVIRENLSEEFTAVIARSQSSLRGMALRRLGNAADAEDAVQDALLSAYRHLQNFKGQAKMSTWLTAIVLNSVITIIRRRSRRLHISLDEDNQGTPLWEGLSDQGPSPEEIYGEAELSDLLIRSSKRLSPILQNVFELREVHGLSIREIAKILSVSDAAAKARLARARTKLRHLMLEDRGNRAGQLTKSLVTESRRRARLKQTSCGDVNL